MRKAEFGDETTEVFTVSMGDLTAGTGGFIELVQPRGESVWLRCRNFPRMEVEQSAKKGEAATTLD